MRKRHAILGLLIMLMLVGFSNPTTDAMKLDDVKGGPYVDKVVYKVISQNDQQILALQNDEVDMIGDTVDPVYINALEADPNIEVVNHTRNGYGKFVINCDVYPLNITAFRRAFAFALNKTDASATLLDGNSVPIDSPLPPANPWSIEGSLLYSYYDQNIILANQTLDDAGFVDIDDDGWREAENGSDFSVTIEVASSSQLAIDIGELAADALTAIGIDATSVPTDIYEILSQLNNHGDFDIVFYGVSFGGYNPTWMVYNYGSDYHDVPYQNPSMFQNESFDFWADKLLNDPTYAGVLEAITEMQKIIIFQCPEIMIYSNNFFSAYRTDQFEGQINDQAKGVANTWTNIKTHLTLAEGGPYGGFFDIALPFDVDTFNFMTSNSASTMTVLDNLYMSLFKYGPEGEIVPYLATNYTMETHADNPSITENHTRFTIDILQNATWSDATPLTADDVAYSFNYYVDSAAYGNPMGVDLTELVAAYAPTSYRVILEFDSESYWHFESFAFDFIIPQHIFSSIGISGWSSWNPVLSSDPHVTCGPFIITDYVSG
ncbi:MAG: ABC transporter substrate-binding protein, partial [Promethearchaeota archaeon]